MNKQKRTTIKVKYFLLLFFLAFEISLISALKSVPSNPCGSCLNFTHGFPITYVHWPQFVLKPSNDQLVINTCPLGFTIPCHKNIFKMPVIGSPKIYEHYSSADESYFSLGIGAFFFNTLFWYLICSSLFLLAKMIFRKKIE